MKNILKLFSVVLLTLVFILPPEFAFAHAYNETRNSCNVFTKRFKSYARTQGNDSFDFWPCQRSRKNCSGTNAECQSNDDGNPCAFAAAQTSFGGGMVQMQANSGCTAGLDITDLYSEIVNQPNSKSDGYVCSNKLNYQQHFDTKNRTFAITEGQGSLMISKIYPGFVELRFTLWKANNDVEDETMTEEKIFIQEYIRIKNNRVELSNGLKNNKSIQIIEDEHFIQINLTNFEHEFQIPEDVDMNEELVANITAFGDPDHNRVIKEELERSSEIPMFSVSPNPSNGVFNIYPSNMTFSDRLVEIKLFNTNGVLIKNLYKGILYKGRNQVSIEQLGVEDGVYFITILGDGIFETKRIVITRS